MKTFTLIRGLIALLLFLVFTSPKISAQAVSANPLNILKPIGPNSVTVTLTRSGTFTGSGNYNWSVSPATGVSGLVASSSATSQTVTFSSAASGPYTFTVSRGSTTVTTIVTICNLLASVANDSTNANRGQWAGGFLVSSGVLAANAHGQKNFFNFNLTQRVSAIGVNLAGFIYYIENISTNSGLVTVTASTANGATRANVITNGDMNLAATTNLGFVRLGVGPDGKAWILASDGTNIYLSFFQTNGLTAATLSTPKIVTFAPGSIGSVATFQNGDICLDGNSNMLVLANNGSGQTIIYAMNPNAPSPVLVSRFQVNDNLNASFTGTVNGVAFDVNGNAYMSTNDANNTPQSGLYFLNANTINTGTGTVQAQSVWDGFGLTDLGSNVWPGDLPFLPVKLGSFTVSRQGTNAVLDWSTLLETNTDHFEIERSIDGVNFTVVGSKLSAGTSADVRNYQFIDPIPAASSVLYYRLKTVDIDAKNTFSKIIVLRLNGIVVKNYMVYPNPFSNNLKIQINSLKEANITIRIKSVSGQEELSRKMILQSGDNVLVLSTELSALSNGMHLMEIITEDGNKITQKIIKR